MDSSFNHANNKQISNFDKKLKLSHKLNLKFALFLFLFGIGYFHYNYYEKRRDLKKKFNKEFNFELNKLINENNLK